MQRMQQQRLRAISNLGGLRSAPRSPPRSTPRSALAREWRRFERRLGPAGQLALDRTRVREGERVLDAGCATGGLSLQVAHRVGARGLAIGLDPDPSALAIAATRAAEQHLGWLRFASPSRDARAAREPAFDAIVSRFGITRFGDPEAALRQLASALVPGGRLGWITWRSLSENAWYSLPRRIVAETIAAPLSSEVDPAFALAERDALATALRSAGFCDVEIEPHDFDLWMGDDVDDALEFFFEVEGRALDARLDERTLHRLTDALRRELEQHVSADAIRLGAAAWLVTASWPTPPPAVA